MTAALPPMLERMPERTETVMITLRGQPFRCHCTCNVFTRRSNLYTCNACGAQYEGDT